MDKGNINYQTVINIKKYNADKMVIVYEKNMLVYVNDKPFLEGKEVSKEDKVIVNRVNIEPKRNLKVETSGDKLEAYLSISYIEGIEYGIEEKLEKDILTLSYKKNRVKAEKFTTDEVVDYLNKMNIVEGILIHNIDEALEGEEVQKILCAKGKAAINDVEDRIEILFIKEEALDINRKINYRDINKINVVKRGEVLGEIIKGTEGENGKDIFGAEIMKKDKKPLGVKCKENCYLANGKIISTIDGKPEYKKNVFSVVQLLQMDRDINMESGNVDFIGDVHIKGNIGVGMSVKSGDSIVLEGNAESCTLEARYEGILEGKTILSTVNVGENDGNFIKYVNDIEELKKHLENLLEFSNQLIAKTGENNFGKIAKVIIENKLKELNKTIFSILGYSKKDEKLANLIRSKFIGLGVLTIKTGKELELIIGYIEKGLIKYREMLEAKGRLVLEYAQDCKISCSGDVIFTGKGSYISNVVSGGKIEFIKDDAIVRGGELQATELIKCKTIGSSGGAKTILRVSEKGRIEGEKVYRNTVLCFGQKNRTIEEDSKEVQAFIKNGEIEIERLLM